MKKYFFTLIGLSLVLSSCSAFESSFSEKQISEMETRISKLEAEVLTIKFNQPKSKECVEASENTPAVEEVQTKPVAEEVKEEEVVVVEPKPVLVPKNFEITEPKEGANLTVEPITFKGSVDKTATKISVKYTGVDYNEEYTLKNFKEGDGDFWYKASTSFKNLSKGKNTYEFKAEFNDGDVVTLEPIVINYK